MSSLRNLDLLFNRNPTIRTIPAKINTTKRFPAVNYSPKPLKIGGKIRGLVTTRLVSVFASSEAGDGPSTVSDHHHEDDTISDHEDDDTISDHEDDATISDHDEDDDKISEHGEDDDTISDHDEDDDIISERDDNEGPSTVSDCDDGDCDEDDVVYSKTFELIRVKIVEGKMYTRLDSEEEEGHWKLTVGCNFPGKWILRWGVQFHGDVGSEWDQPPRRMRPPGSVAVKDYAVDTPMNEVDSSEDEEEDRYQEVKIDINTSSAIASIHFVLKDEVTGLWFEDLGGELKLPLADHQQDGNDLISDAKWDFRFSQDTQGGSSEESGEAVESQKPLEGFYEEQQVSKEISLENSVKVSVRKFGETDENIVCVETDLTQDVLVHWGVCRDNQQKWEIPALPHPPDTKIIKNKALRTRLQPKEDGHGKVGFFKLANDLAGFLFVLRLSDNTWLKHMGNAFFIPLQGPSEAPDWLENAKFDANGVDTTIIYEAMKQDSSSRTIYTNGLIENIRSLVSDISSDNNMINRSKDNQEYILSEIEKLAAEAYSIFTTNAPEETNQESSDGKLHLPQLQLQSGTGTGYEILCQGFNWESHNSGKWYMELSDKADFLSSLGFTIIWLPPPTESISPEGYMPKDLYNLNSKYGTIDELKSVIKKFHEVGIKVLGDVVLNHRCAQHQNSNGIWNIFGGRLDWDDRAVVGDDPHFQGRGNKSSGDNFHAAPNIDHSQEFVRKDITEWMCWLKDEVGYDGWRLDFVRGFWGGYVRDYMKATEPYFAVGEYWDSLSYTYSEMDYDQNAHRQRIIDWINDTDGYSGAFDVTTKGILHSAVGDCQYWRLKDSSGKPPGVVGWWASRAVTFIENHDTGSTQGHWRFPRGKEMQGYAYILTHPGTPSIFYDHFSSPLNVEIGELISLRMRNKLHCRSHVQIMKADDGVYAALIDNKVAMKIGPGEYEPPGDQEWLLAAEGDSYKVWETLHREEMDPTTET